jgi:hypothetical protein
MSTTITNSKNMEPKSHYTIQEIKDILDDLATQKRVIEDWANRVESYKDAMEYLQKTPGHGTIPTTMYYGDDGIGVGEKWVTLEISITAAIATLKKMKDEAQINLSNSICEK